MSKKIPVTQPFLPELSEFIPFLEKIWENKWLTNNGPFHQQLERELCEFLNVKHISLFTNATIALVTALQALRVKGEVITTPYSFVATSHSILWNNLTPVFVDIKEGDLILILKNRRGHNSKYNSYYACSLLWLSMRSQ